MAFAVAAGMVLGLSAFAGCGGAATPSTPSTPSAPSVPSASFSYSPVSPLVNQSVQCSDRSTGSPGSWWWELGDGGTSAVQNPSHTYATAGTFTVTLTAANAAGSNRTSGLIRNSSGVGTLGVGSDGPTAAYQPPCSQGPGAKRYTFTLYALPASSRLTVAANQVTGAVLTGAIASITLGSASLSLSYARPQ